MSGAEAAPPQALKRPRSTAGGKPSGRGETQAERAGTKSRAADRPAPRRSRQVHLVIITGLSGSGKGSAIKAFEDSGYYCVDNLPLGLLAPLVDLVQRSGEVPRVAAVVDIREGRRLEDLPQILRRLRASQVEVTLLFLESSDEVLLRRFSETRRPHPLAPGSPRADHGKHETELRRGIRSERKALARLRSAADLVVDTSRFNAHELRAFLREQVIESGLTPKLQITLSSFGFRHGLPSDAELVFDVRFLPNPNYVAALQAHDGRDRKVADYIRSFPQTGEFLSRIRDLLAYLMPHYIQEGKSYLHIAVGCTGGRHRSVYIAEALRRELRKLGYPATLVHRDLER
ncbi:MAG: RNase adapter RapZ [Terriglobales bacterium]